MIQNTNKAYKQYDLEDRTLDFSKKINQYIKQLPRNTVNNEIGKQLTRSAGSVGANYIEANESLSKKDFVFRIRLCKKEAKESCYWIKLTDPIESNFDNLRELLDESVQLMKIFGAILEKSK